MLTGVVGQPKAGKSWFVLWSLVRPIIGGLNWFTGLRGSHEPGFVVWCDTEHNRPVSFNCLALGAEKTNRPKHGWIAEKDLGRKLCRFDFVRLRTSLRPGRMTNSRQ
jgi:hypothetical protein